VVVAAEEESSGCQEKDDEKPAAEDHVAEDQLLLLDDAEGTAGEQEAWGWPGDSTDDGGDADVGLRLPGDEVAHVGTNVVEDAMGWSGDCPVEKAVGSDGCPVIVVEDGEGFEAVLNVDVVVGDGVAGFDAGFDS